jgi:hypothetical protein
MNQAFSKPMYTIALFNNPPCYSRLESTAKRQIWEDRDTPHLDICGMRIPIGQAEVTFWVYAADGRELCQRHVVLQIEDGQFTHRCDFDDILEDPYMLRISLKSGLHVDEQTLSIAIHRLYGHITNFDGNPLSAYVKPMGAGSTTVKADATGYYEVWLPPDQAFRVFVCDERYSKETLECWLWDLTLHEDLHLNLHVGSLELYRLHAWPGERVVYIHFIPMSLHRILSFVRRGLSEDEIVASNEAHPQLSRHNKVS